MIGEVEQGNVKSPFNRPNTRGQCNSLSACPLRLQGNKQLPAVRSRQMGCQTPGTQTGEILSVRDLGLPIALRVPIPHYLGERALEDN